MSEEQTLTEEDRKQIEEDLKAAKKSVDTEALAKAKEEGRAEAQKEHSIEDKIKEQETARKKLEEQLAQARKEADEKQKKLESQLNELKESKAVINNPFAQSARPKIEDIPPEKIDELAEQAARDFLNI